MLAFANLANIASRLVEAAGAAGGGCDCGDGACC